MEYRKRPKYPIGIQSFETIRTEGYIYVDKTSMIYDLIETGKYYFLSRPRRFGKSLLLSTIKAYFEGRKELFDGLAISKHASEWRNHPVLMLSLSGYDPFQRNLHAIIQNQLSSYEKIYGVLTDTKDIGSRFRNLIRAAHELTGNKTVVLIDEYDSPMVLHLHDNTAHEEVKNLLKSVYINIKDMDEHIRFCMLTGVTRFSKLTVFSGLNNLNDISIDDSYSEICGITEDELKSNFQKGIQELADENNENYETALLKLKENYDGYHFSKKSADIYNPFSLLTCLHKKEIGSYWFQTATPTFLVKAITADTISIPKLLSETVSGAVISDIDTFNSSPLALLFQTGYLTIKGYDSHRNRYSLGVPNKEVEEGLFTGLLAHISHGDRNKIDKEKWDIKDAFEDGRPDKALSIVKSFFAGIPAHLTQNKPEIYFENNLYLLFKLAGLDVNTEWWSSDGRIDMLLKTAHYIYIIELKLDRSAQEAIDQIEYKNYPLQFKGCSQQIIKIGINFSKSLRNLSDWKIVKDLAASN